MMASIGRWVDRSIRQGSQTREDEHQRKRLLILHAASRAFSARGFHDTTIDYIAKQLKVTKPTIYYYVKSKDDLLFQAAKAGLDELDAALKVGEQATGTGRDQLRAFFGQYGELINSEFGTCLALTSDRVLVYATRRKLRRIKKEFENRVLAIIEKGTADGSLQKVDPKIAAFMIFGAFNWMPQWYRKDGSMSIKEISDGFMTLIEGGIARPARISVGR